MKLAFVAPYADLGLSEQSSNLLCGGEVSGQDEQAKRIREQIEELSESVNN